jgi:hypothetical protein
VLDFDEIDDWAPELALALSATVSSAVGQQLRHAAPEFVEDARDMLFDLTNRENIIDATLTWIRTTTIAGYHGSRLTNCELASVLTAGLIPLTAQSRRRRLERALSQHPNWVSAAGELDSAIHAHGPGGKAGRREHQVHLTLSRGGLTSSFNHYLTHGSEFDQRVAEKLLGADGMKLLASDGEPRLIQVAVPGSVALEAAHWVFDINETRASGEVPNLVNQFLNAWSYRLAHPGFQSRTLKVDCGMKFRCTIPADWIVNVFH